MKSISSFSPSVSQPNHSADFLRVAQGGPDRIGGGGDSDLDEDVVLHGLGGFGHDGQFLAGADLATAGWATAVSPVPPPGRRGVFAGEGGDGGADLLGEGVEIGGYGEGHVGLDRQGQQARAFGGRVLAHAGDIPDHGRGG